MSDQPSGPVHPADDGEDGPSPFSREGAAAAGSADQPADPPGQRPEAPPPGPPAAPPGGSEYPLYGQPSSVDPAGPPSDPAGWTQPPPSAQPSTPPPYQPAPPYQPTPPSQAPWAEPPPAGYGSAPDPYDPTGGYGYGPPAQPEAPATYGAPGAYGSGYGTAYGYGQGYGPTDHPKATPALVTGIIGLVTSTFCGVGGLVGIAGVVLGSRAKREIDGDPARWTGRGKAQAGLVTGIIGLVVLTIWMLFFFVVLILES